MIDQTPIDTTPNTPLDAIKGAYLRSHDRIGSAIDDLVGGLGVDEDRAGIGMLDDANHTLAQLVCEALGYDKPGRGWVPTRESAPELYRYDDGSPIVYSVPIAPHTTMDIWPRFDTMDDVQTVLGYSLDLAFPSAGERAARRAEEELQQREGPAVGGEVPVQDINIVTRFGEPAASHALKRALDTLRQGGVV
ncbi:hypothetical protein [Curtobacterium sp. MCBA15_004]|uniref:hypothetical protein n=1 Tax=Curtobacterium sp. MCBA15_004 TaxID=1898733 RepID=UPI0008DD4437|nr:hypothetical protein [Curtobacterium sp. MCBA15_004]WIA97646.1 hypothetical protein QOL16_04425 [Curtobacterium sp. MCBA15_004]